MKIIKNQNKLILIVICFFRLNAQNSFSQELEISDMALSYKISFLFNEFANIFSSKIMLDFKSEFVRLTSKSLPIFESQSKNKNELDGLKRKVEFENSIIFEHVKRSFSRLYFTHVKDDVFFENKLQKHFEEKLLMQDEQIKKIYSHPMLSKLSFFKELLDLTSQMRHLCISINGKGDSSDTMIFYLFEVQLLEFIEKNLKILENVKKSIFKVLSSDQKDLVEEVSNLSMNLTNQSLVIMEKFDSQIKCCMVPDEHKKFMESLLEMNQLTIKILKLLI